MFGSGIDGTAILYAGTVEATYEPGGGSATTANTAAGTAATIRSGTVHTMQQDCYFQNLTLSTGGGGTPTLKTNGFRLFVKDTLTIQSGCTISNDGSNSSSHTGGEGGAGGTLSAGTDGSTGGQGGSAAGGQSATNGGKGGGGGGGGGFVFISARTIANSGTIRSHGGEGGNGGEPGV